MPSVHIVGQILGASGFTEDKLFCKYKVVYDHKSMTLIAGDSEDVQGWIAAVQNKEVVKMNAVKEVENMKDESHRNVFVEGLLQ